MIDSIFWLRVHGGATHFPIALVFGAAFFETIGLLSSRQRAFAIYLSLLATACALLGGAGFSGGELLLGR